MYLSQIRMRWWLGPLKLAVALLCWTFLRTGWTEVQEIIYLARGASLRQVKIGGGDSSVGTLAHLQARSEQWRRGIEAFQRSPMLGVGFGITSRREEFWALDSFEVLKEEQGSSLHFSQRG